MSALTRRNLLATATVAAAASPIGIAAASTADPIFAAIEAHRAAQAEVEAASAARNAAEEALGLPGWPAGWSVTPEYNSRWEDDPAVQAALNRQQSAWDAEGEAMRLMICTKPTTAAGLLAFACYGCELQSERLGGVQHHYYTGHGGDPAHNVLAAIAGLDIDWRDTEDEDEGDDS